MSNSTKRTSEVKSQAMAFRHSKINPVLKIDAPFQSSPDQ